MRPNRRLRSATHRKQTKDDASASAPTTNHALVMSAVSGASVAEIAQAKIPGGLQSWASANPLKALTSVDDPPSTSALGARTHGSAHKPTMLALAQRPTTKPSLELRNEQAVFMEPTDEGQRRGSGRRMIRVDLLPIVSAHSLVVRDQEARRLSAEVVCACALTERYCYYRWRLISPSID
jgi:hypothetical protein